MIVDVFELTDRDYIKELVSALVDNGVPFRYEKTPFAHRIFISQEHTPHLQPIFRERNLWFAKTEPMAEKGVER